jgi:hypothetical protein
LRWSFCSCSGKQDTDFFISFFRIGNQQVRILYPAAGFYED